MKLLFKITLKHLLLFVMILSYSMSANAISTENNPSQTENNVSVKDSIQQEHSSLPEFIENFGEKYDCIKYNKDGKKTIDIGEIPFIKNHPLSKKYLLYLLGIAAGIFILFAYVHERMIDSPPLWLRMLLCTLFIILFIMELIYFIFPNEGGHLLYFLFPSEVGWLMMIVDIFLMIGIVVGQFIAYGRSHFLLHKNLVPIFSPLVFIGISTIGFAVAYAFDIVFLQKHLFTVIGIFILIQTFIIIFYNIKEKQPVQMIVEIPFFIIGILSTTIFIGTALALIGGIILTIILFFILLAVINLLIRPGAVISAITGERVKIEKDSECINCLYYMNGQCTRSSCKNIETRRENGD